jgi:hypothetical protein
MPTPGKAGQRDQGQFSQLFISSITNKIGPTSWLHYTRLGRLARDKYSSLLGSFLSYQEIEVLCLWPQARYCQSPCSKHCSSLAAWCLMFCKTGYLSEEVNRTESFPPAVSVPCKLIEIRLESARQAMLSPRMNTADETQLDISYI